MYKSICKINLQKSEFIHTCYFDRKCQTALHQGCTIYNSINNSASNNNSAWYSKSSPTWYTTLLGF